MPCISYIERKIVVDDFQSSILDRFWCGKSSEGIAITTLNPIATRGTKRRSPLPSVSYHQAIETYLTRFLRFVLAYYSLKISLQGNPVEARHDNVRSLVISALH